MLERANENDGGSREPTSSCTTWARASGSTTSPARCSATARLRRLHRRALGHRPDLEPDDLRQGDLRRRRLRRADRRGRPGRSRPRSSSSSWRSPTCATRPTSSRPSTSRTDGVDGWVSLEVSPLLADDTAATIEQAAKLHGKAARENLFIKIPGTEAGPAGDRGVDLRRHPDQRHPALLARAVPGRRRGLHEGDRAADRGGARPGRRLGRLDLRQPLGRGRDGRRRRTSCSNRLGIAVAMRAYRAYRELLDSERWQRPHQRGRPPAAAALGEHRDQGPGRLRRPLHRGAAPRRSRSTRCPRRPCTPSPTTARCGEPLPADGGDCEAVLAEFDERRDRRRGAGRAAPGGGQAGLRQVLGGPARVDRDRAREGRRASAERSP